MEYGALYEDSTIGTAYIAISCESVVVTQLGCSDDDDDAKMRRRNRDDER